MKISIMVIRESPLRAYKTCFEIVCSGVSGVKQIERAIASRFPKDVYRTIWYINARKVQSVPRIPHVHLWTVKNQDANLF